MRRWRPGRASVRAGWGPWRARAAGRSMKGRQHGGRDGHVGEGQAQGQPRGSQRRLVYQVQAPVRREVGGDEAGHHRHRGPPPAPGARGHGAPRRRPPGGAAAGRRRRPTPRGSGAAGGDGGASGGGGGGGGRRRGGTEAAPRGPAVARRAPGAPPPSHPPTHRPAVLCLEAVEWRGKVRRGGGWVGGGVGGRCRVQRQSTAGRWVGWVEAVEWRGKVRRGGGWLGGWVGGWVAL